MSVKVPEGWTGADEAEAGLLGEPEPGLEPDRFTDLPGMWEGSDLIGGATDQEPAGAEKGGPAPVRTHEWDVEGGGSAVVTVETGGTFLYPDWSVQPEYRSHASVFATEILRLAGRAQAAEAALASAEAYAAELAEDRDRIHRALIEASVALEVAEGRADVAEELMAKASPGDWVAERRVLDTYAFTADGHGYTVRRVRMGEVEGAQFTTGPGEFDHISAAGLEILRLAADNVALRDGLNAASLTAEEGLEINAELTAALAALLGEPPPEPCSAGCRTPHLSAKAGEAVDEALGRWRELEAAYEEGQAARGELADIRLEHAELLADIGELKAQEASAGNYVIRSMRELRRALQARGLWRPAGQGEPGGGTAGSAIEAIDRLTARNAILNDLADDACEIIGHLRAGYEGDAKKWGSDTIQGKIREVVDDASGLVAERFLEAEREKVAAPLRAEIDRLAAELGKANAWSAKETNKAMWAEAELAEARALARHNAEGWEAALSRETALLAERDRLCEGLVQGGDEAHD